MPLASPALERVRAAWARLLSLGDRPFPHAGVHHVTRPVLAVRVVALGDGVVVAAPDAVGARLTSTLAPDELTRAEAVGGVLGHLVQEVIGVADLAYASDLAPGAASAADDPAVAEVAPRDARLDALREDCPPREWHESGVADLEPRFGTEDAAGALAAVAGYTVWVGRIAHIGVLAHPRARGTGQARAVAARAVRDALARGLVPQWRAARGNPASAALGRRLGFLPLGAQLTMTLWASPSDRAPRDAPVA